MRPSSTTFSTGGKKVALSAGSLPAESFLTTKSSGSFQRDWQEIAAQLGFPNLRHDHVR